MRENARFWIFSFLFILVCIFVIVYIGITRRSDEIYIRDISKADNATAVMAETENDDFPRIGFDTGSHEGVYESGGEKININTASVGELTNLPGIGEVIAERIIKYREESGDFLSIEEIMDVSGIGEGKFEAIKDLIVV